MANVREEFAAIRVLISFALDSKTTKGMGIMRRGWLAFLLSASVFVAACGGAGTVSVPAENFRTDPTGDAGASPTFDVTEVRSMRGSPNLQFSITTSPAPALPAAGFSADFSQMGFIVGFDTDLNAGTGPGMGGVCGFGQGLDYAIGGGVGIAPRNTDGTFTIFRADPASGGGFILVPTGTASVSQIGQTITLVVPLAALGGDDGRTNSVTLAFIDSDDRDCAPDAGQVMPTKLGEQTIYQMLTR